MHTHSARRLGVLALILAAALTGCGGPVTPSDEAPQVGQTEQGVQYCDIATGLYCTSPGTTCVFHSCLSRCDAGGSACSSGFKCCPGEFDPNTGVGSAPYCAKTCLN
ncbi:hypothetical protein JGU66_14750 [Myxococcaceae bacterium JPH2]|nr:hypothetical protein [Myxococcaceae bacterium JPH2]